MTPLVAGFDLGKSTATLALATPTADRLEVLNTESIPHNGQPFEAFSLLYRKHQLGQNGEDGRDGPHAQDGRDTQNGPCIVAAATGIYAVDLLPPLQGGLPEDACLEASLRHLPPGPCQVINAGARGYAVAVRQADGQVIHRENDKCSSGTGETMVKIAARFGMTLAEADQAAETATGTIPITARCSVFAKSEMTHYGNQGRPADQLFRGFFESAANNVAALLEKCRVPGPIYLVGGCTRINAFVRALESLLQQSIIIPEHALYAGALGAAELGYSSWLTRTERLEPFPNLPKDPRGLHAARGSDIGVMPSANAAAHRVRRMVPPPISREDKEGPFILGLDLGSTGSKAVLCTIASGRLVTEVYDQTRGNPVDATQRLLKTLCARKVQDVRAIAVTGSGREAAATVLRAAFGPAAHRIFVRNEIVAHATAAIACDEDGGASLSVVEIGGQDAKFIQIVGGQIIESDMNRACSAGTGSFLEEQAHFYGVHDIQRFGPMAERSSRPPDLGQMCTVFVAEAAGEAIKQGFEISDVFAGFQYAVIHNYLNRVMGQRSLGARVFFQGKPATSASLANTLAMVTGREVVVPPNPGAMGAWGIALCARSALDAALFDAEGLDLKQVLGARIVERAEFVCRDARCKTFCTIDRTSVQLGEQRTKVLSGGACPKYELVGTDLPRPPVEAPNAFEERHELLRPFLNSGVGAQVTIPLLGEAHRLLPYFSTFFEALGIPHRVVGPGKHTLKQGERRSQSSDLCCPMKLAHGMAFDDAEFLFIPKVLSVESGNGAEGRTCVMKQALPDMLRQSLQAQQLAIPILSPTLHLQAGLASREVLGQWQIVGAHLGATQAQVTAAVCTAAAAQRRYEASLRQIGERTLTYARQHHWPVLLICGSQHVIHEPAIDAGIPKLVRENGALALPVDCMPVRADLPAINGIHWAESHLIIRAALAARERGQVYPLLLSSFGCGPASFTEHIFHEVLKGYPHTLLETDGHGGTAGYVTRIQAFMFTVRARDHAPAPLTDRKLEFASPLPRSPLQSFRDARIVVFALSDYLGPIIAGALRALGFDATSSGPTSPAVFATGKRDCSGKECLPYQLIWGSFRQYLDQHPPEKRTILLQVSGASPCRNGMFSIKDRIMLEQLGLADRVEVHPFRAVHSLAFGVKIVGGLAAWDLLKQLYAYHALDESHPGEALTLYRQACDQVLEVVARPWRGPFTKDLGARGAAGMLAGGLSVPGRALRDHRALLRILAEASAAFAALGARGDDRRRPTALLSGDIYVRLDGFGGGQIVERLHAHGIRVLLEPLAYLSEYMAEIGSSDLIGLPTDPLYGGLAGYGMIGLRRLLEAQVVPAHPWIRLPSSAEIIDTAGKLLDHHPRGEAPITIGSVLYHWERGLCDGVVVASPWGCGPALISESLLRYRREIPMLFQYNDGHPVDERGIRSFAFRLKEKGGVPRAERESC